MDFLADHRFYWALFGGLVPAALWLWFWLKEDAARPEPKGLIGLVFVFGALGVVPAFFLERLVKETFFLPSEFIFGPPPASLIVAWVLIEEILKFGVVYLIALRSRAYDEPLDAMIYMVTAAIGFAALENTLYLFNDILGGVPLATFALTGNLRFIGATILHIVSSGILGFCLALGFGRPVGSRLIFATAGLTLAAALHAAFNISIINLSSEMSGGLGLMRTFLLLWLAAVLIILLFEKVKNINQFNLNPWPKNEDLSLKN